MAKPSMLRRRRGTKSRRNSSSICSSSHPMLQMIIVGMVLIAIGLVIGLMVGLHTTMNNSSSTTSNSSNEGSTSNAAAEAAVAAQRGLGVGSTLSKTAMTAYDVNQVGGSGSTGGGSGGTGVTSGNANAVANSHLRKKAVVPPTVVAGGGGGGAGTTSRNGNQNQNNNNNNTDASSNTVGVDMTSMSAAQRKQAFLDHTPIIGTQGTFPYYPSHQDEQQQQQQHLISPTHDFSTYKALGGSRFEEWRHGDSPYTFNKGESDALAKSRRYHVKKAMQFAWKGYEQYAFGMDEILPETMTGSNGWGGFGTTLVDTLDTLWLMDMKDEFYRARDWVRDSLNNNRNRMVSFFETTIRSLGGLLSAYDWSGDEVFLEKANDLGKRLFAAIESNALGLAYGQVNLATGATQNIPWTGGNAVTAEFGTVQIEFRMLARLTGNAAFKEKSEKMFQILKDMNPPHGLYPNMIRNTGNSPQFGNQKLTFGAMGDSLYEYMLKVWLQGGKTESMYREMYDHSIQGMYDELLQVTSPSGLVYIADKNSGRLDTKMDHLVCFMGGLLALGAYTDPLGLDSERAQRDLKTGKALTYTCYQMYARMPTGISPEYIQVHEGQDFDVGRGAPHYLLRPETLESFFILYHLTGDPVYREWGWEVFQSIERYCKTTVGYGQLKDVRKLSAAPENKMETFFLAETMKYFYLLFDPDTPIDLLHKHVFNTEAHPVRMFPVMDAAGVKNLLLH